MVDEFASKAVHMMWKFDRTHVAELDRKLLEQQIMDVLKVGSDGSHERK